MSEPIQCDESPAYSSQSQNNMQSVQPTTEKKTLDILELNSKLLKKLPQSLSKHIQIYQNIHKDVDNSDHNSMHLHNKSESSQSNLHKFASISTEFVDHIANLKANFTQLQNRYLRNKQKEEKKIQSQKNERERNNVSNFDLFVSEHTKNSVKNQLAANCNPVMRNQSLRELNISLEELEIE